MPVYEIRWSRKAVSYLKRIELSTRKRIIEAIERLSSDPSNPNMDVKPLQGRPGEFRLRVGDYRIIFEPEQHILLISVIAIRPRGDVYRRQVRQFLFLIANPITKSIKLHLPMQRLPTTNWKPFLLCIKLNNHDQKMSCSIF